jgi:hypothetical protein
MPSARVKIVTSENIRCRERRRTAETKSESIGKRDEGQISARLD